MSNSGLSVYCFCNIIKCQSAIATAIAIATVNATTANADLYYHHVYAEIRVNRNVL